MKVECDKEAKALYIALADIPDGGVDHTEELVSNYVFIDKNEFGQIVGIEVLGIEEIADITNKAMVGE